MKEGWVCPLCGRGVFPYVDACPCFTSDVFSSSDKNIDVNLWFECSKCHGMYKAGEVCQCEIINTTMDL